MFRSGPQLPNRLQLPLPSTLALPIWAKDLDQMSNEPEMTPEWAAPLAPTYLMSRAASIYGGSNEVQRNIVAQTVLG